MSKEAPHEVITAGQYLCGFKTNNLCKASPAFSFSSLV